MYEFYPTNETYTGNPQHVSRFCMRASLDEAKRWEVELEDEDYRDARDTMVADRAASIRQFSAPTEPTTPALEVK